MQKMNFKTAVIALIASCTLAACGSSKQTASKKENTVVSSNICEQLQEEKPALRAVGKGSHFREQTAKNIAEMQARAQFARAIASKIKAGTAEEASGYDAYSVNTASGNVATDQAAKSNDFATSIAEGVVRNTVVIKTYKELSSSQQYDVWVCLEYQGDVAQMAKDITAQVQERIPDEQKLKMNFEFEKFRQRMQSELEKK